MKFVITVEKGSIVKINGVYHLWDIAKQMAIECIGDNLFPEWESKACTTLMQILEVKDSFGISALRDIAKPATKEYVQEVLKNLNLIFYQFKYQYEVPKVLADGDYTITNADMYFFGGSRR